MIPNHTQFIAAIQDRKKVWVRFYSKPDSGVLDRVCAPMDYSPGADSKDGLNRYWFWDYASDTGSHTLGLMPQQILDLQVVGEAFDPAQFIIKPSPASVAPTTVSTPAPGAPPGAVSVPVL